MRFRRSPPPPMEWLRFGSLWDSRIPKAMDFWCLLRAIGFIVLWEAMEMYRKCLAPEPITAATSLALFRNWISRSDDTLPHQKALPAIDALFSFIPQNERFRLILLRLSALIAPDQKDSHLAPLFSSLLSSGCRAPRRCSSGEAAPQLAAVQREFPVLSPPLLMGRLSVPNPHPRLPAVRDSPFPP